MRKSFSSKRVDRTGQWWHEPRTWIYVVCGVLALVIVGQLLYPRDRLLPNVTIDNKDVGWWHKKDTTWELDRLYSLQPIKIYFGSNNEPQQEVEPSSIGLVTSNESRVASISYPWYVRLVPSSFWWYGVLAKPSGPRHVHNDETLAAYIKKELGTSCDVKPINAELKANGDQVEVVPSSKGGTCELDDVKKQLQAVAPVDPSAVEVRIPMEEIAPDVADSDAEKVVEMINQKLKGGVPMKVAGETVTLEAKTVAPWIKANVKDKKLVVTIDEKVASGTLSKQFANKVAVAAGVTRVKTHDFSEVSRVNGKSGRMLDVSKTSQEIGEYITIESLEVAEVAVKSVAPRVEYSRTYSASDTGLSALMKNYAQDNPGTYGVQLIELSGERRRASYNGSKQFVAASTYKLFVAYGVLKKVEAGTWKWTDTVVGGRDLSACFDDMIVLSDNPCAETLLRKYGYNNLTRDIRALGLSNSSGFIGDGPKATATDLGLFMAMLESGQMPIKSSSRSRLLGALKRNVYQQGIPAGTSGTVADKVGFLDGLLHDASIVYGSKGAYVLVIMTDNASWKNIAELTKQIESIRR